MKRRTFVDRMRAWEAGDVEAATAVLERPDAYGGEGSGIVQWARRVVARAAEGPGQIVRQVQDGTVGHPATNKSNSGN